MGRRSGIWIVLLAVAAGTGALGQDPDRSVNVFAITDALEKNQRALAEYTWKLKVEVALDGATLSEQLFQARMNDGRFQSELIEATETDEGRRRSRGRRDLEHRQRLRALLMSYVNMSPEKLGEALTNAAVSENPDGGSTTRVQARGAIREGDSYDLWIDSSTRRPRRFEVFTSLDGEPVRLVARFEKLERGPVYPAEATVETEIKEKKMIISLENFEFEKLEPASKEARGA